MQTDFKSLMMRKLVTTIAATTWISLLMSIFSFGDYSEILYNQGNKFIGGFFFYFIYIGAIILIYGNLVSIGIEYLQGKWFPQRDWVYILILGVFGLANGLFFQIITLAFYGMLAAMLYGIIDKWLYRRDLDYKSIKILFLIPIATITLSWSYLQFISPPLPPFTKEDAVKFATSGEGTAIDYFPKEIGKWEGTIDGYQVTRETSAIDMGEEIYIVTFSENWGKGSGKGSWSLSYKVERGSLTAYGETGSEPPYYKGN